MAVGVGVERSIDDLVAVGRGERRESFVQALRTLWSIKTALVGLIVLIVLVVAAVIGPILAPESATKAALTERLLPPVWSPEGTSAHLLGTDALGRDVFWRLVVGARLTVIIGTSTVLLSVIVGTALGLLAGYKGGRWDTVIMRTADAQLAFPGLLLVLFVLAVLGASVLLVVLFLAVYGWMIYARLVRSIVLRLKHSPATVGAELVGCSTLRILGRHMLPLLYAPILTQAMLELARIVLAEAALSFLGMGVQPPAISWGLMVAENRSYISQAYWAVLFPGLAIVGTVLAINLVASWLRIHSDPQQRQRQFAAVATRRRQRRRAGRAPAASEHEAPRQPRRAHVRADAGVPLLAVKDLDVRFESFDGEFAAVRGASFEVHPGETLGIVGESGSGKSSSSLAIVDLVPTPGYIAGGTFEWRGQTMSPADMRKLRGSEITMIFQDPMTSLSPLVPVGRQVSELLEKHRGMTRAAARARTMELFSMVGIPSPRQRMDQLPHELSGGLRQRVLIAAALAPEPSLLIADEPTTALDATVQAQILELIADLQERLGIAMILITHDLGVVARVCDRVAVMYGGRVVEHGGTEELFANPRHPYTEALIATVPRFDERVIGGLPVIPGSPPSRLAFVPGCPFAPRCSQRTAACDEMPGMAESGSNGSAREFACWHPVGTASTR